MLVLLDGYEDELDAILDTVSVNVKFDSSKPWYYGPFEENGEITQEKPKAYAS